MVQKINENCTVLPTDSDSYATYTYLLYKIVSYINVQFSKSFFYDLH